MNERLLQIRKELKLSQRVFGEKLGLSESAISNLESGKREITKSNEKLLCSTYNVNEEWFQTGNGEMFNNNEDDELAFLIGGLFAEDNAFKKRLIKAMLKLDESQLEQLKGFAKLLAEDEG